MNMNAMVKKSREPLVEECDAGLTKLVVPVFYKDYSICSLMVEGGGLITGSFHRHRLMDEYNVILAPKIAGDNNDFSCVRVGTPVRIENFSELALWKLKRYGDEVYLRYFSEDIVCLPDS